ncbi:hypothetical protein CH267_01975 [Rhodococcus sp. 06-621-2]|nr:hypothetical protein [Rhodococcus sp. 06-621-2]OZC62326.1 hypothetical protein CH267_01975 [Rhodococcus sp. 06-621-2]
MPNNNSVLAALIDELAAVTEHYSIHGRGDRAQVVAWVTPAHTGPDLTLDPGATNPNIEARGQLTDAIERVLEKIALAAPQAIPA